jgi:peptidoglycan/xylan/chitin deacetylase (PgdA/CDA1 family)
MSEQSYCSFHPSREAQLRCHSCDRCLCDRCVKVLGDEVFCSRTCYLLDFGSRLTTPLLSALRQPVPRKQALVVAAAAAALLVIVLLSLVVVKVRSSSPSPEAILVTPTPTPSPTPTAIPAVTGRMLRERGRWTVEVQGPPGSVVLLIVGDKPIQTIELDAAGRGRVRGLRLSGRQPQVELIPLGETRVTVLPVTPTPRSTSTPTPTPTLTLTATATPTPTPTPTPMPTLEPTATVQPTATAKPSPSPSPPPATMPPSTATPAATRAATPPTRAPRTDTRPTGELPVPPTLHLVSDAGQRLALTFDGGSSSNGTADLLDLLKRLDLKVSIFLTGSFIERDAALVRRAVAEGHEIGNHTYSHPHLTTYAKNRKSNLQPGMTREHFHEQLKRTERAFMIATGRRMAPLWRAPYGEENKTLRAWAFEAGYLHVRWSYVRGISLDAWDWVDDEHSSLYQSSESIMERLLRFPRLDGGIVLMHLATHRSEPPWQALPELVSELQQRGLELISVSDMLAASPKWSSWLEQARRNHLSFYGSDTTFSPVLPAGDSGG